MTTKSHEPAEKFVAEHFIFDGENPETVTTAHLIRLTSTPEDPSSQQVLRLVEESGVLDFWSTDEEDGYSEQDGEPI